MVFRRLLFTKKWKGESVAADVAVGKAWRVGWYYTLSEKTCEAWRDMGTPIFYGSILPDGEFFRVMMAQKYGVFPYVPTQITLTGIGGGWSLYVEVVLAR